MICGDSRGRRTGSAIARHLASEIGHVCGDPFLSLDDNLDELGLAIEQYLSEQGESVCVESGELAVLASVALAGMGNTPVARRLYMFGSGIVAPSEWLVSGAEAMWVLDLEIMTVRCDPQLELAFFRTLDMVLDSIAEVWDVTSGMGVLGLKDVCRSACLLLGSREERKVDAMGQEICSACRAKLVGIAEIRGWSNTPSILNLDG